MKKSIFICFVPVIVVLLFSTCSSQTGNQIPVKLELLSQSWNFNFPQTSQGVLTAQNQPTELNAPDDIEKGFTIKFKVDLKRFVGEETILEIPDVVNVRLFQNDAANRKIQNYPAFKMSDGSVPVLEASVKLKLPTENQEIRDLVVGVPLAILEKPVGEHEVILNFSGIQWTMYIDGKLVDNEFALGYPVWSVKSVWKINPMYVAGAEFFIPAVKPSRVPLPELETDPEIHLWTPTGHNAWVGDVATLFHDGRYHVFYLYDRRHHESKFGRGAHYFEHISTVDFKTWTEHEAATPIDEQWETFGTGTPFVFNGKFCISYGLHTTRIYPKEQTTLPEQWAYLEEHGSTGFFTRHNMKGYPGGSTYSISADGISQFKKTGVLFHPCENPSVYTAPDGKLRMLANYAAKGTWESESIDGGWRCIDPEFPPGGDCTFPFRWGQYDYVIGGFTGFWSRPVSEPNVKFTDVVQQGFDFYNGINVPAISEISGGRFLMTGWMGIRGWGGPLLIHEMIQFPDGRIGTKWMEEITPLTKSPQTLAKKLSETVSFPTGDEPFMLSFTVNPGVKSGRLGILFSDGDSEENACEWQIWPGELRAQFAQGVFSGFAESQRSLRQGGRPHSGRNYAIENLIGVDKPFTVKIIVKGTDKLGGSIIDAEIAEKRTMIGYRPVLRVNQLLFRVEGIELSNVKIAPLLNNKNN